MKSRLQDGIESEYRRFLQNDLRGLPWWKDLLAIAFVFILTVANLSIWRISNLPDHIDGQTFSLVLSVAGLLTGLAIFLAAGRSVARTAEREALRLEAFAVADKFNRLAHDAASKEKDSRP